MSPSALPATDDNIDGLVLSLEIDKFMKGFVFVQESQAADGVDMDETRRS